MSDCLLVGFLALIFVSFGLMVVAMIVVVVSGYISSFVVGTVLGLALSPAISRGCDRGIRGCLRIRAIRLARSGAASIRLQKCPTVKPPVAPSKWIRVRCHAHKRGVLSCVASATRHIFGAPRLRKTHFALKSRLARRRSGVLLSVWVHDAQS